MGAWMGDWVKNEFILTKRISENLRRNPAGTPHDVRPKPDGKILNAFLRQ